MRTTRTRLPAAVAAVALAAALGGCAPAVPGYQGETMTLTIGTDDSPGVPSADQVAKFAEQVKTLSNGKVTIEPKWHAAGSGPNWDQRVAAMVQKGDLDLALGPTWAWDVLGVHSLEPLQTPFLIDSDELVAKVITDPSLAGTLLSGLPGAGVHGLSLWPEGLRHPFGFDKPLTAPQDFAGQVIRSARSDASTRLFKAFGASTTDDDPDANRMVGSHGEYALSPNGIGAVNITFFPKVNLLYANATRWAGLKPDTQQLLANAAAATQAWAISQADDIRAGKAFCDDKGILVAASHSHVDALHTKAEAVIGTVTAAHPDTVAAITALKSSAAAPSYAASCVGAETKARPPGAAEKKLNGTYRFVLTVDEFLAAGFDREYADNNAGVQTFALENGQIFYRLEPSQPQTFPDDGANGTYQVDGDILTTRFPTYDNEVDHFYVAVLPGGDLQLTFIDSTDPHIEFLMTNKTWKRVT